MKPIMHPMAAFRWQYLNDSFGDNTHEANHPFLYDLMEDGDEILKQLLAEIWVNPNV